MKRIDELKDIIKGKKAAEAPNCLLYTSDAADE